MNVDLDGESGGIVWRVAGVVEDVILYFLKSDPQV